MKPILVHCHLYYPDLWEELKKALSALHGLEYELYLTCPQGIQGGGIWKEALELHPAAHLVWVENRGYDIAPFLHILSQVDLNHYSYCIKLHTKRTLPGPWKSYAGYLPFRHWGASWRKKLLSFMKGKNLKKCLHAFDTQKDLGMVAESSLIANEEPGDMQAVQQLKALMAQAHLDMQKYGFVMGSMFICRAGLLLPLQQLRLQSKDFAVSGGSNSTGTLAHAVERFLGASILSQGYAIRDVYTPRLKRLRLWEKAQLKAWSFFWKHYDTAVTSRGYHIIKIFRITIWHKKIKPSGGKGAVPPLPK